MPNFKYLGSIVYPNYHSSLIMCTIGSVAHFGGGGVGGGGGVCVCVCVCVYSEELVPSNLVL